MASQNIQRFFTTQFSKSWKTSIKMYFRIYSAWYGILINSFCLLVGQ